MNLWRFVWPARLDHRTAGDRGPLAGDRIGGGPGQRPVRGLGAEGRQPRPPDLPRQPELVGAGRAVRHPDRPAGPEPPGGAAAGRVLDDVARRQGVRVQDPQGRQVQHGQRAQRARRQVRPGPAPDDRPRPALHDPGRLQPDRRHRRLHRQDGAELPLPGLAGDPLPARRDGHRRSEGDPREVRRARQGAEVRLALQQQRGGRRVHHRGVQAERPRRPGRRTRPTGRAGAASTSSGSSWRRCPRSRPGSCASRRAISTSRRSARPSSPTSSSASRTRSCRSS